MNYQSEIHNTATAQLVIRNCFALHLKVWHLTYDLSIYTKGHRKRAMMNLLSTSLWAFVCFVLVCCYICITIILPRFKRKYKDHFLNKVCVPGRKIMCGRFECKGYQFITATKSNACIKEAV